MRYQGGAGFDVLSSVTGDRKMVATTRVSHQVNCTKIVVKRRETACKREVALSQTCGKSQALSPDAGGAEHEAKPTSSAQRSKAKHQVTAAATRQIARVLSQPQRLFSSNAEL
jgi:hypothetical protein